MYKVAIIGAGIGSEHAQGYLALPDRFDVTHICDLDVDRGEALAARTGAIHTTDFEEVLSSNVALVDICLPPHLHLSFAQRALEAGKHVVCEKPLVSSLKEADALVEVAKATNRVVFPVFQYRFGTGTAQLRALEAAGLTGKPFVATLETHWNRPASYYDVDWRGTWATERGGALLGHAIHIHDLLTGILGPVAEVHAMTDTRVNRIEVEDCAALAIRMANGTLVTSSVTLGAAEETSRLRFLYEGMTVESDHACYRPAAKPWTFTARAPYKQGNIDEITTQIDKQPFGFHGMLIEVANALDGKPNAAVVTEDGRRSLEFVTAAYHSSRTGQPVKLPIGKDHPLYDSWMPS